MKKMLLPLAAAGIAFPIAASVPAFAQETDCACVAAKSATGSIVSAAGDVKVLQSTGYAPGAAGTDLAVGSRVIVGPRSSARIALGATCQADVPGGVSASIQLMGSATCLRLLDSTTTAQTNGESMMPLVIFGATAGTGLTIGVLDENDKRAVSN